MIGQTVSHYTIIEKLGSGGMGEVYLAKDTKLNRKVALKFLPSQLVSDEEFKARFTREAQAAAKLNHPNIITIYEVSEHDGMPYFAMEYIEGASLNEIINTGELSIDQSLDIVVQICDGLQAAHNAGIVHRDIKPSNIVIDKDSRCRILDFGLAAIQTEEKLTKSGSSLGTVNYMSPEQVQGEKVDHRSDIFSLGVIFYEMITGQLPFKGDYDAAVTFSIINDTPEPLARYKSDVPENIQRIVSKALEKNTETRYQHIDDLIADLKGLGKQESAEGETKPSIAVLPFLDMSPEKDQEYFCDGMAEELINGLTRLDGLNVAARTSAFQIKGKGYDIPEIGKRLKVKTVLEGSIRKAGDRLRITAQLVNVADGFHLWSAKYDRDMDDIFAIQDEISLTIVDKLKVSLLGEERSKLTARGTENQEAYNLYLKGRYFWNRRYEGGLQKSIEHFQQAIEKDPGFALAYSGLADGFAMLGTYSFLPPKKAFTMAKNAALKALELDDSMAEAVTSLAYINMFYDWDWEAAEKGYKRAIELDPHYASAHEWYGMLLAIIGRYDESIGEMKSALALDPLGLIINTMMGWAFQCLEDYDKAIEQYNKTIEMDPNFTLAYFFRAVAYIRKSMYPDAIQSSQKFVDLTGGSQSAIGALGFSYASSGDNVMAHEILGRLKGLSEKMHVSPFYTGLLHSALGEKDLALADLEKAYLDREPFIILINCWHLVENLRSDPRHGELIKKLNLEK